MAGKLNGVADSLSRRGQVLSNQWSLSQAIFQRISSQGMPVGRSLCHPLEQNLPLYVSPLTDDQALAVDALTYPWKGLWGYAYSPTEIMAKGLTKIRREECRILLKHPTFHKPRGTRL